MGCTLLLQPLIPRTSLLLVSSIISRVRSIGRFTDNVIRIYPRDWSVRIIASGKSQGISIVQRCAFPILRQPFSFPPTFAQSTRYAGTVPAILTIGGRIDALPHRAGNAGHGAAERRLCQARSGPVSSMEHSGVALLTKPDRERWTMEGQYNKVYRARDRVPRPEYTFLLERLVCQTRYVPPGIFTLRA